MMNRKEFIKSQKECAEMLGMSLKVYEQYCKNIKVSHKIKKTKDIKNDDYNKEILEFLKLDRSALKKWKEW